MLNNSYSNFLVELACKIMFNSRHRICSPGSFNNICFDVFKMTTRHKSGCQYYYRVKFLPVALHIWTSNSCCNRCSEAGWQHYCASNNCSALFFFCTCIAIAASWQFFVKHFMRVIDLLHLRVKVLFLSKKTASHLK